MDNIPAKPEKSIKSLEGLLQIAAYAIVGILLYAIIKLSIPDDGMTEEMKLRVLDTALANMNPSNVETQLDKITVMFAKKPAITWETALAILTSLGSLFGLQGFFTKKRTDLKAVFDTLKK